MPVLHNSQIYGTSGEERKSRKAAANGLKSGWWERTTPNAKCVFSAFQHKKKGCRWVGEKVADLGLHESTSFSELLQPGTR